MRDVDENLIVLDTSSSSSSGGGNGKNNDFVNMKWVDQHSSSMSRSRGRDIAVNTYTIIPSSEVGSISSPCWIRLHTFPLKFHSLGIVSQEWSAPLAI